MGSKHKKHHTGEISYREIARLLHEMTCSDRERCNYPDPPDMSYMTHHLKVCMGQNKMDECRCSETITTLHCMNAVNAENLATTILGAIRVVR